MLLTMTYLHFFLTLFAVVNPIGALPVYISLTEYNTYKEKKRVALISSFSVTSILIISFFIGHSFLNFFSISIDSFKVAGGLLICLLSFSMLQGKFGPIKRNQAEKEEMLTKESVAVVPLALPLMAGPGAISSVIVYASHLLEHVEIIPIAFSIGIITLFGLVVYVLFITSFKIVIFFGQTGINVISRIMGLIMLSMGIEIMSSGLKVLFPGLM